MNAIQADRRARLSAMMTRNGSRARDESGHVYTRNTCALKPESSNVLEEENYRSISSCNLQRRLARRGPVDGRGARELVSRGLGPPVGTLPGVHVGRLRDRGAARRSFQKKSADIFFKVPTGAVVPRHTHTSAERMVLVSGALRVTYDGHDPVDMKPGIYAYGPAELPHKAVSTGAEACVLAIGFEQPVDAFQHTPGDG